MNSAILTQTSHAGKGLVLHPRSVKTGGAAKKQIPITRMKTPSPRVLPAVRIALGLLMSLIAGEVRPR